MDNVLATAYWGYEKAFVPPATAEHLRVKLPRFVLSELERELTKQVGLPFPDNKTTFRFADCNGEILHVTFHDSHAYIGRASGATCEPDWLLEDGKRGSTSAQGEQS